MPATSLVPLVKLDQLDDPGAASVIATIASQEIDIVVGKCSGDVFAYHNACPHKGTPLETVPGRFFTADGRRLLCTSHWAEFRPDDGMCIAGPCVGKKLRLIDIVIKNGMVYAVPPSLQGKSTP